MTTTTSTIITKLILEKKRRRGRPTNPDTYTPTPCDNPNCSNIIQLIKWRYDHSKYKKFYCSHKCHQGVRRESKRTILQNCKYCNKEIAIYKFRYDHSKYKNFYCNFKCKSLYKSSMLSRTSRFMTHYRCKNCTNYFPHAQCKIHETPNGKYRYPVCPDPRCGNLRMQTRPRHSRLRHKFIKQMKEIEMQKKQQQQQEMKKELSSLT